MLPDPCPFTSSHASGCEVAFHRGFDLHFPNNRDAELLFTCLLATLAFLKKFVFIWLRWVLVAARRLFYLWHAGF